MSDLEEDSNEEEVYFPNEEYTSGMVGGFSMDEDDLDCYDGYEAKANRYEIARFGLSDNMANENVPAPAPTRSDDRILPFGAWVPIGKSNYVLDLQKKQRNPIFQISVDILQNTNFFRAFTALAFVPAIYIQQFWNTLTQEAMTRVYQFQLDEDWFTLDANLLREALEITPIDQAHQFESPPSGNAIMDFVNEMGYPEELYFVSRMAGIITRTNVDYVELIWEEFIQAIQTFLTDKANLGISTKKDKKTKPHVIPYCRFTKLIICYLGRKHNINQRSESPFNMAEDDRHLRNLKFVPKGEEDEVFGMQIPKELITNNIRNTPYYNAYLKMVAKHDHKITAKEGGKKKSASKLDQSKKPVTAKQPKPVSSKQSKPAPAKQPKPAHGQAPVGGVAFHEPASSITQKLPIVEGKGKGIAIDEHVAQSLLELQMPKKTSTMDQYIFQRWISVTEEASTRPSTQPEDDTFANIVCDTPSPTYAKTGAETNKINSEGDIEILNIGEEQGEDVATKVDLEEKTTEIDEGQAGQTLAGPNPGQSHVALAGPDPEPMYDDFVVTVYPQVHESLKHPDVEHVHVENPLSLTGTLLSMKNLEAYTFDPDLASRVSALEQVCANFKKRHKLQDKTVQGLSSRVFTLELWDLPYKIDQTVNEAVKEAVQIVLQAPLKERFRDLFEDNVKEILHDRMFKSGSYRSQPEHVDFYEALEASMERDNRDEFLTENDKSRERRRDDQDPLPPLTKESEQNKKKKQDSDASDSEDIGVAQLPKIKTRPDWLKPVLEEDRPETLEPDWVIPLNDLPEPENNWANSFATSYKDPKENNLL
ncbi:hypothetical protein Tco_0886094 [Tanacetum coccineum]